MYLFVYLSLHTIENILAFEQIEPIKIPRCQAILIIDQFFDASDTDADFWADVEEDPVLRSEETKASEMTEVESEAVILVEVE